MELENKDGLQRSYGNQAVILKDWGRQEAMASHKKKQGSAWSWGTRTVAAELRRRGRDPARLGPAGGGHGAAEEKGKLCLEFGNEDDLQRAFGNQALACKTGAGWRRPWRGQEKEALCLELGNRSGLAYCYWYWGLLAREQRDRKTEREKLLPP